MANWVGFSDEELRRMKQGSGGDGRPRAPAARAGRGRPPTSRGRAAQMNSSAASSPTPRPSRELPALPAEARLSRPPPPKPSEELRTPPAAQPASATGQASPEASPPQKKMEEKERASSPGEKKTANGEADGDGDMILDETDIIKHELQNVEKFQFKQKLIEEQNKKKRELLATAIVERQKKAKQEASRLVRIQKELAQLDHLLAVDVSIIRNRIEEASREYMEAQRRYERAEKEFIEAKMDLHHKCEQKDSLTEHLHLIIHQNEMRKACKLTELMHKLSLEDGDDDPDGSAGLEDLTSETPSLFILNELQSNHEQQLMMMKRTRTVSESSTPASPSSTSMKRSSSTGDTKLANASSASTESGGVTGWISSWLLGKPAGDSSTTGEKPVSKTEDEFLLQALRPSLSTASQCVITTEPSVNSQNQPTDALPSSTKTSPPGDVTQSDATQLKGDSKQSTPAQLKGDSNQSNPAQLEGDSELSNPAQGAETMNAETESSTDQTSGESSGGSKPDTSVPPKEDIQLPLGAEKVSCTEESTPSPPESVTSVSTPKDLNDNTVPEVAGKATETQS